MEKVTGNKRSTIGLGRRIIVHNTEVVATVKTFRCVEASATHERVSVRYIVGLEVLLYSFMQHNIIYSMQSNGKLKLPRESA